MNRKLDADVVLRPGEIEYHIGHKSTPRPFLPKFRPEECEDDLYAEDFKSEFQEL